MNELLENMLYHGATLNNEIEIVILRDSSSIRVLTSNLSINNNIRNLVAKSNQLNSINIENVKAQYLDKLKNDAINDNGQMGIGLELISN